MVGVMLFVLFAILIVLNPINLGYGISLTVLVLSLVLVIVINTYISKRHSFFKETDKHRVFFPKIQSIVSVLLIEFSMVYYSSFFCVSSGNTLTIYDYINYASVLVMGCSLYIAVRMKKIAGVQFFHVTIIPICLFIVMTLPKQTIIGIIVAFVGLYSIFQCIMTDKNIINKILLNMRKHW